MVERTTLARVYRFNDYAALSLSTGKTVYIRPQDAKALASALAKAAADIESRIFTKSELAPINLAFKE